MGYLYYIQYYVYIIIYICTYYIIISCDGISWDTMGYHGIQQESNGISWHVMGCSDTVRYMYIYISIYI